MSRTDITAITDRRLGADLTVDQPLPTTTTSWFSIGQWTTTPLPDEDDPTSHAFEGCGCGEWGEGAIAPACAAHLRLAYAPAVQYDDGGGGMAFVRWLTTAEYTANPVQVCSAADVASVQGLMAWELEDLIEESAKVAFDSGRPWEDRVAVGGRAAAARWLLDLDNLAAMRQSVAEWRARGGAA